MKETGIKQKYCTTETAARYLGLSARTLQKYRSYGAGPKYKIVHKRAFYAIADLEEWLCQNAENKDVAHE